MTAIPGADDCSRYSYPPLAPTAPSRQQKLRYVGAGSDVNDRELNTDNSQPRSSASDTAVPRPGRVDVGSWRYKANAATRHNSASVSQRAETPRQERKNQRVRSQRRLSRTSVPTWPTMTGGRATMSRSHPSGPIGQRTQTADKESDRPVRDKGEGDSCRNNNQ